jgi:dihydroorotate dehydrogenase
LGLHLDHPIGLAAGLDKHARALPAWWGLGFAFAELGTVTPLPQPGNPQPRMFRLTAQEAIINRMGFPSDGLAAVVERLRAPRTTPLVIGVNVGKNKATADEDAEQDYVQCIAACRDHADYLVINVSSPNTPGLRALQAPDRIERLVARCVATATTAAGRTVPVLLKVAPDFGVGALEETILAAMQGGVAGIVASNTTLDRNGVPEKWQHEAGGLSGVPLRHKATETVRRVRRVTQGRLPIMGVGGVASAEDAWDKIRAGADLVQLYSALVLRGPAVVGDIAGGLAELQARDGFAHWRDAVGVDA